LTITTAALRKLIREYTREAGVRNLEREVGTLCRKVAREVAAGKTDGTVIDADDVQRYLGQRRYHYGLMEEQDEIAAATGLVYTEFGGDIVTVEVSLMKGQDGKLTLTGQLGDVMKESAHAALSYARTHASEFGIPESFFAKNDIHVHVPEGAIPKDGPSAGVTIATAMLSLLTGKPVHRKIAMTGEITLRGEVLPVGGIKEKVLAAHRAKIRTVILPALNKRDLEDINEDIRKEMKFILADDIRDVFKHALIESKVERRTDTRPARRGRPLRTSVQP